MELKVDLAALDEEGYSITDRVIQAASARIKDNVGDEVRKQIREIVEQEARAEIVRQLANLVTRPIQPTNQFGENKGEPITLRELIIGQVGKYLEEKVDGHGKRADYSREGMPRTQWFVREEARKLIDAEYAKAIQAAAVDMRKEMDSRVGDLFRQAVYKLAGVPELPAL